MRNLLKVLLPALFATLCCVSVTSQQSENSATTSITTPNTTVSNTLSTTATNGPTTTTGPTTTASGVKPTTMPATTAMNTDSTRTVATIPADIQTDTTTDNSKKFSTGTASLGITTAVILTTEPLTTPTLSQEPTTVVPNTNSAVQFTSTLSPSTGSSEGPKKPPCSQKGFDGASFVGGIVLVLGLVAICIIIYKCRQCRSVDTPYREFY